MRTQEQAVSEVQARCKELGYTCSEFKYIGVDKTMLPLTCHAGHSWDTTSFYSFVKMNTKCRTCNGKARITQNSAESQVSSKCIERNFEFKPFKYIGVDETKIGITCSEGHEFTTTYYRLIRTNSGCPTCAELKCGDRRRLSPETIVRRLTEICDEKGFTLVEDYKYTTMVETKLTLKCSKGHIWSTTYNGLVNNKSGCHECGGSKKKNQSEVISGIEKRCNDSNYKFVNKDSFKYKNVYSRIDLKCHCGNEWNTTCQIFLGVGSGCPKCANCQRLTQDEATLLVENACKKLGNYTFEKFEYIGNKRTKVTITCSNNHTWTKPFNQITSSQNNAGCIICAGQLVTQEEAEQRVNEECKSTGYVVGKFVYKNSSTRIPLTCSCGHSWKVTYSNYISSGRGCPACAGRNQTYAYVNIIMDGELPIALKYGVEKVIGTRHKQQSLKCVFEVQPYLVFEFKESEMCKEAERACKQTFGKGVLTRLEMTDGYTETTGTENLDKIIEIYKRFGGYQIK